MPSKLDTSPKASFMRKLTSPKCWKETLQLRNNIFICGKILPTLNTDRLDHFNFHDPNKVYLKALRARVNYKKVTTEKYGKKRLFSDSWYISKNFQELISIQDIIIEQSETPRSFAIANKYGLQEVCFQILERGDFQSKVSIPLESLFKNYFSAVYFNSKFIPIIKHEYY